MVKAFRHSKRPRLRSELCIWGLLVAIPRLCNAREDRMMSTAPKPLLPVGSPSSGRPATVEYEPRGQRTAWRRMSLLTCLSHRCQRPVRQSFGVVSIALRGLSPRSRPPLQAAIAVDY